MQTNISPQKDIQELDVKDLVQIVESPKPAKSRSLDPKLIKKMKAIIAKYTDRPELLENIENFSDDTDINFIKKLNIDSVDVVEIVVDVEEEFDITITDSEITAFKSFGDMYDLIDAKLNSAGQGDETEQKNETNSISMESGIQEDAA